MNRLRVAATSRMRPLRVQQKKLSEAMLAASAVAVANTAKQEHEAELARNARDAGGTGTIRWRRSCRRVRGRMPTRASI